MAVFAYVLILPVPADAAGGRRGQLLRPGARAPRRRRRPHALDPLALCSSDRAFAARGRACADAFSNCRSVESRSFSVALFAVLVGLVAMTP